MLQLPLLYQTCESTTSAVAFGGNRLDWNWQCGDERESDVSGFSSNTGRILSKKR